MKIAKYTVYAILVITIVSAISCSKQDRYIDILKGKEVVYTGKPDSLIAHSGRNRVAISWLLSADPKITKAVIYWNNYKDSLVVPITRTAGVDSIGVIIPNLAIGVYNFVVYTYDSDNHRSVPVYATGRVFGDDYEKHLINRRILSAYRWNITAGPLFIVWDKITETTSNIPIGARITYKDDAGVSHTQITGLTENDTTIVSMPANVGTSAVIEFSTLIKPDIAALDTFYAAKEKINYSFVPAPANIRITEDVTGTISTDLTNSSINKPAQTFTRIITIARNKLDKALAYSVNFEVGTSSIPPGTIAANMADVSITTMADAPVPATLNVAANESVQLKVTMPRSVLDDNPLKMIAFNITLANLKTSKFNVDGPAFISNFVVDVEGFKELQDVTSTYILNAGGAVPFERSDAGTGQFGTIKDWKINVYVQKNNTGLGKRGFSTNNEVGGGYMYAARLSGDAKPTEGKIYQNLTLPLAKYVYEMDFKAIAFRSEVVNNAMYLAVIERDTLPATGLNNQLVFPGNISECIAYTKLNYNTFLPPTGGGQTSLATDYTSKLIFQLPAVKTVALGVVISYQNTNGYFLCRGVKLKKYVLKAFD